MTLIPNLGTVIFEIVNFLVLAGLLYFFVFKPMMRNIKKSAENKVQLQQQLESDREESAALKAQLAARLADAGSEAAQIVAQAKTQAQEERVVLLAETQTEMERVLAEAHTDAARLRKQSAEEFNDSLLTAILEVSGLLIGQVAPPELQDAMVKQLNDRIWEMGRSEMQQVNELRRSLGTRTPTVVVRSAMTLTPEQQGQLARTFTALADRNVNLDIQVEPELGVGVRVRLGDLVMDNCIAGKLEALQDSVAAALIERLAHV